MHYTQTQRAGNFESAAGPNQRAHEDGDRAAKGAPQRKVYMSVTKQVKTQEF